VLDKNVPLAPYWVTVILNMPPTAQPSALAVPARSTVTVIPANIECSPYSITLVQAERMIAQGVAVWVPGLRRIREVKSTRVRGERKEWRPVMSGGCSVLQLVPPRATTSHAAKRASGQV